METNVNLSPSYSTQKSPNRKMLDIFHKISPHTNIEQNIHIGENRGGEIPRLSTPPIKMTIRTLVSCLFRDSVVKVPSAGNAELPKVPY